MTGREHGQDTERDDDVATCEGCGASLLKRTDDDGRVWIKCTGDHGAWFRFPMFDADHGTDEWRELRAQELARIRARWNHADFDGTTRFNAFMQQDRFVTLGDGQAALVAIGALEEDDPESDRAFGFSVVSIAAKLGWSIDRTLDGLSLLRERGCVEEVPGG